MGSQPPENADVALHLESKAVSLSYSSFPNVSRVLHLLDIERRVALAVEEKLKLTLDGFLEMIRQRLVVP